MVRGILSTSIQFRFLVIVLAAALMAFGAVQLREMPVDVLPEFSPPFVEIQTEALGLSAEEVEQMITVPMEQDLLAGVAWIDTITSRSVPGLSSVTLFFEPETDLYRARQMVSERMAQAAVGIPHVSKPPTMIQPQSSYSRFMIIGLSSQDVSLIEMSVLARWVIGPRLLGVPGVANVAIWGNRDRQLQVQVDPEQLRAQGVTLQQVIETTGNALWVSPLTYLEASTPGTGGFIDTPNQRIGIWHVLPITSPEELAQVPIENAAGLRLADVADVVEGHQPLIGDGLINDGSSLMLVVEKLPGVNTLEVTEGVEAALAALQPGMSGIEFDTSLFRSASFIEMVIDTLSSALLISAVLLVVALLFLMWDLRTALISFLTIGVSLMSALFVLYLRGETLNTMVFAGLAVAIGVIIADAVVDVDHIARRIRQRRQAGEEMSIVAIVLEAAREMRTSLLYATLILLLAVAPVLFVNGVSGAFFKPLILTYALAVGISMLTALLLVPGLSVILLSNAPLRDSRSPVLSALQHRYDQFLANSLGNGIRTPVIALIAITLIITAGGLVASPLIKQQSFLPTFKEPYILINWEGAPGISHPEMDRIVGRATRELRNLPGVSNVGAHVGRAVLGDQVVGVNSAQIWVSIDPAAEYNATVSAVQEIISGYPGLAYDLTSSVQQILSRALPGASGLQTGEDITVRVYGENYDVLRRLADDVKQSISGIEGVTDLQVNLPMEEPILEIRVDLAAAQRHGIKPGEVRRAAATLLSGIQVGSLFEEQKIFDVIVWSNPEIRSSLTNVRELLIETPSGGHVRLEEVADVEIAPAPTTIQRSGISPYLDVTFNVIGRNLNSVAGEVRSALQTLEYPLEYHTEVLEDYAERQANLQGILLSSALALIGIFLLLQAAYNSWRLALVAIVILPAALAGGVLAGYLAGGVLTVGSLIGLLAVLGIAVRNGIVATNHLQWIEQHEKLPFGPELVRRGMVELLGPIATTALAGALALLPFVLFGDSAGFEILRPMAITFLGGLVTTTVLDLFVLPVLYLKYGATREADLGLISVSELDAVTGE